MINFLSQTVYCTENNGHRDEKVSALVGIAFGSDFLDVKRFQADSELAIQLGR